MRPQRLVTVILGALEIAIVCLYVILVVPGTETILSLLLYCTACFYCLRRSRLNICEMAKDTAIVLMVGE